ncbi:negative elongation factor D-like isoform X2 [Polyodon spathula]|uniref:negative elongation factor D-like isoform X2 n=1 Tax=Polyodon spathula TaxID=7913 RepID=UPI001B7EE720|nr:negative elongation factor D-like isoform X2 [Polyodon spathula]
MEKFSSRDYIMKPSIFTSLKTLVGPQSVLSSFCLTVLFKMFTSMDPPPMELIRVPAFLDLFMQSLFKPGAKINQDHKYIHILAYAASVVETWKKNKRVNINKDELKSTSKAIEMVHNLCCNENKGATELSTLYRCIRFPVVVMGLLKWVDWTVSEPRYFQLQTDHTPVHLALLDEISTCHQLLHPQVLQLLIKLFETEHSQLDVMEQMELKKTLLDRMVHLLSRGYVLLVVGYIRKCLEKLNTDISLIRYFVTEVLDVIAPPYPSDFVQLFLPILENDGIAGTIKTEGECDPVAEFIGKSCTAVWQEQGFYITPEGAVCTPSNRTTMEVCISLTLNCVPDNCLSTYHGTCRSLSLFRIACSKLKLCRHICVTSGYVKYCDVLYN